MENHDASLNTDFSLELALHVLLQEITKKKDSPPKNFVISPFSIHTILLLTALGATGRTLDQLVSFLRSKDLVSVSSQLTNLASGDEGGPSLSFVNGVWIKQGFGLKPAFQKAVKGIYNAKEVDFPNKSVEVIEEINAWAEQQTNGLIKNLLPANCLKNKENTVMLIIANALYFKSDWEYNFDITRTTPKKFNLLNNETVEVPFMTTHYCDDYHSYRSFKGYKLLCIPYEKGKFAMYFFLLDEVDGLKNLVTEMKSHPGFFTKDFGLYSEYIPVVWIPKFKFSYELKAKEYMRELGLELPFDDLDAEITEMVNRPVFVSEIYHKAGIEVNEEGTEAAASTAELCEDLGFAIGGEVKKPISFVADHPFMFMIREEDTNVVFFVGAVVNPIEES